MQYKSNNKLLAPVALFTYNRVEHTIKTVEALKKNHYADKTILYIFSDGPKSEKDNEKIQKLRLFFENVDGFKETHIFKSENNQGLANSIISGVSKVFDTHDTIIVLEDDLISSEGFLSYMNSLLSFYDEQKKIGSICGYNFPSRTFKSPKNYNYGIYFSLRPGSWGWATWKDRWLTVDWDVSDFNFFYREKRLSKEFNKGGEDLTESLRAQMDGRIDSWAIRWAYHHYKNKLYCVYPVRSFVNNIGMDDSGTHTSSLVNVKYSHISLNSDCKIELPPSIILNNKILKQFKKVYQPKVTIKQRLKKIIKACIKR